MANIERTVKEAKEQAIQYRKSLTPTTLTQTVQKSIDFFEIKQLYAKGSVDPIPLVPMPRCAVLYGHLDNKAGEKQGICINGARQRSLAELYYDRLAFMQTFVVSYSNPKN